MSAPTVEDTLLQRARKVVASYDRAFELASEGHTDAAITVGIAAIQSFDDKTQWFEIARAYIKACEALEKIIDGNQEPVAFGLSGGRGFVDGPFAQIARAALSCSAPPEEKQGG